MATQHDLAERAWKAMPHTMGRRLSERTYKAPPHVGFISWLLYLSATLRNRRPIIPRLGISLPPGSGKSELVDFYNPIWLLEHDARRRIILASYAGTLAEEQGKRVRNQIEMAQDVLTCRIMQDSRAADRWRTNRNGGMWTVGVGGSITGRRASNFLIDDPHKNFCPAVDEKVLTSNRGWTVMGDVVVGDEVFAPDGSVTAVTEVHERHCGARWRVTFSDGETVDTDGEHRWRAFDRRLWTKIHRRRDKSNDWSKWWDDAPLVTTADMAAELRDYRGMTNWTIPNTQPLELRAADLPIDPYLFGYWLGDGFWSTITCHADDVSHLVDHVKSLGWNATSGVNHSSSWVRASVPGTRNGWAGRTTDSLPNRLRALGVWDKGTKTVPAEYLAGSVAQRRALLAGLVDADGSMTRGGQAVFTNTNPNLVMAVHDLVVSLGAKAMVDSVSKPVNHWRVTFTPEWCPFRIQRKVNSWDERSGKPSIRRRSRTVTSIEQVADHAEFVCIAVDHPSHLFLIGRGLVPTHNSEATSEKNQLDVWNWYTSTARTRLLPGSSLMVIQCVAEGEMVELADGRTVPIQDVKVGDQVWGLDESQSVVPQDVLGVRRSGEDEILKVSTVRSSVKVNARHPFLVIRNREPQWVRAGDLSVDDLVVTMKSKPTDHGIRRGIPGFGGKSVDNGFCWLFGDWYRNRRRVRTTRVERVTSIEVGEDEPVWDLAVEGEAFVVQNFITHNTRWAEMDLIGRLRAQDEAKNQWLFVKLPAIAEENESTRSVLGDFWFDRLESMGVPLFEWRREEGEALWPELEPGVPWFDVEEYEQIRHEVGEMVWAGLYQQRPAPLEGEMFKRSDWVRVDSMPAGPHTMVRRWDLAASTKGDWTATCLMAYHHATRMPYILEMNRDRLTAPEVKAFVRDTAEYDRERFGDVVHIRIEREPGSSGKNVESDYLLEVLPDFNSVKFLSSSGDKTVRAYPLSSQQGSMHVHICRRDVGGTFETPNWWQWLIEEAAAFPNAKHDDLVDVASLAWVDLVELVPRSGRARAKTTARRQLGF